MGTSPHGHHDSHRGAPEPRVSGRTLPTPGAVPTAPGVIPGSAPVGRCVTSHAHRPIGAAPAVPATPSAARTAVPLAPVTPTAPAVPATPSAAPATPAGR